MSIAEVYHIIIKTNTLLKSHLLILSENDDITTNEEWQECLIKEIQEIVSNIKSSCDYIVNTNNTELAQQMIILHNDIKSLMSCYKTKFTKDNRLVYFINLSRLYNNMRFILNYFKTKGVDINLQRFNIESGKSLLDLPTPLKTDRAKKYFAKAEEMGYLEKTNTGYKSKFRTKVLLAYFLELVFCRDDNNKNNCMSFPETMLNELFQEKRLGKYRGQIYNNANGKPKGYEIVDKIFD